MHCKNCGRLIPNNASYCAKCGSYVGNNINNINNINNNTNRAYTKGNKLPSWTIVLFAQIVFWSIFFLIVFSFKENTYFSKTSYSDYNYNDNYIDEPNISNDDNNNTDSPSSTTSTQRSKYQTSIVYDHVYNNVNISNASEAKKLIEKDSLNQKSTCPDEIKKIEDEIIKKYNITAVNLCEMDVDFARELGNVFEKIYNEFPKAREHLTNLTLWNTKGVNEMGIIAAFMPIFKFATSPSGYPWVIKTHMLLSSRYFLNHDMLLQTTNESSKSGHFPANANEYSPIAHELGHYLSYIAMMKHYGVDSILLIDSSKLTDYYNLINDFSKGDFSLSMIKEAYNNYIKDTGDTIGLDEWRGTISEYALAKDNSGKYIYDETIAEAFHDVYLNGNNAKDASKYIYSVLKSKYN